MNIDRVPTNCPCPPMDVPIKKLIVAVEISLDRSSLPSAGSTINIVDSARSEVSGVTVRGSSSKPKKLRFSSKYVLIVKKAKKLNFLSIKKWWSRQCFFRFPTSYWFIHWLWEKKQLTTTLFSRFSSKNHCLLSAKMCRRHQICGPLAAASTQCCQNSYLRPLKIARDSSLTNLCNFLCYYY